MAPRDATPAREHPRRNFRKAAALASDHRSDEAVLAATIRTLPALAVARFIDW
jgi:hypothetical protein